MADAPVDSTAKVSDATSLADASMTSDPTASIPTNASPTPAAQEATSQKPTRLEKPKVQVTVPTVDKDGKPLSKSAIKKLRKTAEYEALRPYRKARDKLKRQQRVEAYREGLARGLASEELVKPKNGKTRAQRAALPAGQSPSGLRVIVDCSFDALMADKEIKSMTSQLTRCYADNKAASKTIELIMSGMCTETLLQQRGDERREPPLALSKIAERYEKVFKNQHHNWRNFKCVPQDYLSTVISQNEHGDFTKREEVICGLQKTDLIYLSANAEEDLETLETSKTYIIGGIVDKNRHKLLCQKKATKQGIATRRLPISQYIKLSDRNVLTVNHVFEILLEYAVSGDWGDAFKKVIPIRKQAASGDEDEGDEEKDA
jgi:tRNA (guanine9-N1)-methyltransferase